MIQYHKKFYFDDQFLEITYPISARCYAISQHNDFIRTDQTGNSQIQKTMLKFGHWLLPINISFYISTDLYAPDSLIPLCAVPHKHPIFTSIVDHFQGIKLFSHLASSQCCWWLTMVANSHDYFPKRRQLMTPQSNVCIRVIGPPELSNYALIFELSPLLHWHFWFFL